MKKSELARYIDHTLLKVDATEEQIKTLCKEAIDNKFYAVCVNSSMVKLCKKMLAESDVKICSVVCFPLGAMSTAAKGFETKQAVADGANEIDMVINIGMLKDKKYQEVEDDIHEVVKNASPEALVKVIIEAALLTDDEIVTVCKLAEKAGAKFVKTSTGVNASGATTKAVELMRKTVSENVKVKAAGGVRSFDDAVAMINAGAERLGTSSGVSLVNDGTVSTDY